MAGRKAGWAAYNCSVYVSYNVQLHNVQLHNVQCTLYTHVLHFFMVVEVFNNLDG